MAHEDGPMYHPVVATVSLGSHTILHYYRYQEESGLQDDFNSSVQSPPTMDSHSRPIDPRPVLSILLEPRSLVVTTNDLYRSHLHGIDNVATDHFLAHGLGTEPLADSEDATRGPNPKYPLDRISVANWALLGDSDILNTVREGGSLKRSTRISLTCRVVERAINPRILALGIE